MKKLIRKFIGYFGYDFIKVDRTPLFKKDHEVNVGRFTLIMPSINPLIKVYKDKKDFAAEIGRIFLSVYEKYPQLTFIDIGANTGDTVAIIKSLKEVPVISVEGDPFTFSYLRKNVGQFTNVQIFNNFLGEKNQTVQANLEKAGWNTTIIPSEKANSSIELKTLDSLLAQFPNSKDFKLLKIDTEGFDTIILRGAMSFVSKTKPVIYIEYNRDNMAALKEDGLSTLFSLLPLGYDKILLFDDQGRYILSTSLSNKALVTDLHNYCDGKQSRIYYYNICLFHSEDDDIATGLIRKEVAQVQ